MGDRVENREVDGFQKACFEHFAGVASVATNADEVGEKIDVDEAHLPVEELPVDDPIVQRDVLPVVPGIDALVVRNPDGGVGEISKRKPRDGRGVKRQKADFMNKGRDVATAANGDGCTHGRVPPVKSVRKTIRKKAKRPETAPRCDALRKRFRPAASTI